MHCLLDKRELHLQNKPLQIIQVLILSGIGSSREFRAFEKQNCPKLVTFSSGNLFTGVRFLVIGFQKHEICLGLIEMGLKQYLIVTYSWPRSMTKELSPFGE